jgi:hypothetical protein
MNREGWQIIGGGSCWFLFQHELNSCNIEWCFLEEKKSSSSELKKLSTPASFERPMRNEFVKLFRHPEGLTIDNRACNFMPTYWMRAFWRSEQSIDKSAIVAFENQCIVSGCVLETWEVHSRWRLSWRPAACAIVYVWWRRNDVTHYWTLYPINYSAGWPHCSCDAAARCANNS